MSGKTFLGFGFGPIQSGLMLAEAQASGNFGRYVIAEVLDDLVDATRRNDNRIVVNIAHADRIENRSLSNLEIYNPRVETDRAALVSAIREADELATAIPSVTFYEAGGETSIAALLAEGLDDRKPRLLYACENNNYAAELLVQTLEDRGRPAPANFQAVDTVVGKMSGIIDDAQGIAELGLVPMTPDSPKAVLVEAFNRILVSRVRLPGFRKGIEVFEEKDDLLPFEEAKLFGHNAIHALLGYLAADRGYRVMSEIRDDAELLALARDAFINESGAALIRKHGGTGDPLFTAAGYAAYADDLLERMTNPWLHDEVARIARDPRRKLGYGDRLLGTMREALTMGIRPSIMARGAAAAIRYLQSEEPDLSGLSIRDTLERLWAGEETDVHRTLCIQLIEKAER